MVDTAFLEWDKPVMSQRLQQREPRLQMAGLKTDAAAGSIWLIANKSLLLVLETLCRGEVKGEFGIKIE